MLLCWEKNPIIKNNIVLNRYSFFLVIRYRPKDIACIKENKNNVSGSQTVILTLEYLTNPTLKKNHCMKIIHTLKKENINTYLKRILIKKVNSNFSQKSTIYKNNKNKYSLIFDKSGIPIIGFIVSP